MLKKLGLTHPFWRFVFGVWLAVAVMALISGTKPESRFAASFVMLLLSFPLNIAVGRLLGFLQSVGFVPDMPDTGLVFLLIWSVAVGLGLCQLFALKWLVEKLLQFWRN